MTKLTGLLVNRCCRLCEMSRIEPEKRSETAMFDAVISSALLLSQHIVRSVTSHLALTDVAQLAICHTSSHAQLHQQ